MASIAAPEANSTNLPKMMERLGLDPGAGSIPRLSLSYITASHRCQTCSSRECCGTWLACHPGRVNFAPPFCPNGDILFEMKFNDPAALR